MNSDIEHLKKHKIIRHDDGKKHLGTYPPREPLADEDPSIEEAFGGSSEQDVPAVAADVLRARIVDALETVYDPEIPLNIYALGLIYGIEIDPSSDVEIAMTLTAPGCPVAGSLVREVATKVGEVDGVRRSHVRLTWDPPWTQDRMSDEALLELGLL